MPGDEPTDSERFEAIFAQAIQLGGSECEAFLKRKCGEDAALRRQLEELIAIERERSDFMEDPSMEHSEMDPMLGSSLGPYKILERIGEGGYGVVYLAEQREPISRQVALKVIKLGMDTEQVIARFEAERQALAMMEHPNIAKVFDAGCTKTGRPYFVMELVRGVPITDYCEKGKLPSHDSLQLFMEVCRAVHHAHQKGIIHRDLKPNNILVFEQDGTPVSKVIDFGIAKATNIRLTEKTVFTEFQQFIGTPAYTSPEQVGMSGMDVDTRSDIYSLGVLLYELLTGTTPVEAETLRKAAYAEIQRTILETEPPKPSTRVTEIRKRSLSDSSFHIPNADIDDDLDWIVMKALEKDRERRYDSANAFLLDIERFLAHEPVSAAAPSGLYRFLKYARRNKATVAVVATLLVGTIVSLWQAVRATSATTRAEAGELAARKNVYIADMNVAQSALESGNIERAIMVLERHIPRQGEEDLRHWEWRYFWGQAHRELFTFVADDDPSDKIKPDGIFSVVLSSDGKLMATAGRNGRIRLWDLHTQAQVFQFEIPPGYLAWVDISPNGEYLLASSGRTKGGQSELVEWSVLESKEIQRFSSTPSENFRNPKYVTDTLICSGGSDGSVWFHDLKSGESQASKHHDNSIVGVSVTGSNIVTTSKDRVNVWDAETKEVITTLEIAEPQARNLAELSPDGRWISSCRVLEPKVTIYERDALDVLTTIYVETPVQGTQFSRDSSLLVISEIDGTVRLFETETWENVEKYHLRSHQLNDIEISDDGAIIVAGGDNGVVSGWPVKSPHHELINSGGDLVNSLEYSSDGRVLAVGASDGRVEIWEAETGKLLFETPPLGAPSIWLDEDFFDISPDCRQLAVAPHKGGTVALWDLESLTQTATLEHDENVNGLSYSPDGKFLASGCESGIRLWDLPSRKVVREFGSSSSDCLAFSPDARVIATQAGYREGIVVWEVASGDRIAVLDQHVEPVGGIRALSFSPDGAILASGGYDGQVILWDTGEWELVRRLLGHDLHLWDLTFSPDSKRLVSGADDNWCVLWDVDSGHEIARFPGNAVDFSPDGNTLAAGSEVVSPGAKDPNPARASTVRLHRARSLGQIGESR